MSRALWPLLVLGLACRGAAAQKPPQPTAAARAVAALEARLAALLAEGTEFERREAYEALLAEATKVGHEHQADPAAAKAHWVVARCCEVLGKHPEKDAAFVSYVDALLAHSKARAAQALRREAESLIARRELFSAIKVLKLALSRFADGPEAAYALGRLGACYLWMDRPEPAIEALREVLQRWPQSPDAAEARLRLARANLASRKYAETVRLLEAFVAAQPKAPQRPAALFDLAVARQLSGDYYGALLGFQQVIREAPQSPYAPLAHAALTDLRRRVLDRVAD